MSTQETLASLDEPAVSASPTAELKAAYRPELDILRLFAFLSVFMLHGILIGERGALYRHFPFVAGLLIHVHEIGKYGLPLFFFLSSYLITTLLVVEKKKTGTVHLPSFYLRRVLRIWPLYLAYLCSMFVVGLFVPAFHFGPHCLLGYLLVSGNWYIIHSAALPTTAIFFLWSISAEEQFYLVWPTLVRGMSTRGILLFCSALGIASLICTGLLSVAHAGQGYVWLNTGAQAIFFAGGGILALYIGLREQRKSVFTSTAGIALGLALWYSAEAIQGFPGFYVVVPPLRAVLDYLLVCFGCASLLLGFLHMPRIWIHPSLVYLGRISFGLYVFQGMALLFAETVLARHLPEGLWLLCALLLCVLCAIPSYELYEKPFLRLKRRFEFVRSRPVDM